MTSIGRAGSRQNNAIRRLAADLGVIENADGSARLSIGNTVVLAAINGPRPPRNRKHENFESSILSVNVISLSGYYGKEQGALEQIIFEIFDPIIVGSIVPRSVINLSIHLQSNDGSFVSAAINAACLAFIDAGIDISCIVGATSIGASELSPLLLDPDALEESSAVILSTIAYKSTNVSLENSNPLYLNLSGVCREEELARIINHGRITCKTIIAFLSLAAKKRALRSALNFKKLISVSLEDLAK